MRPFSIHGNFDFPVNNADSNTTHAGYQFQQSALDARAQLGGAYNQKHGSDLAFAPVAGWGADYSLAVQPEPSMMLFSEAQTDFDAFNQWAHSESAHDNPGLFFTPDQKMPSLLPPDTKAAISARLSSVLGNKDNIFQVIADDILLETGVLVTEGDVARQLNEDRATVSSAFLAGETPQETVFYGEYIPQGGGHGIRRDAAGRVSMTEKGILPSELPALLAPYRTMPDDTVVVDPENPARLVKLASLRSRYRSRELIPDPQDNTKLVSQGALQSRRSDQKRAVDAHGKPQLTTTVAAQLSKSGQKASHKNKDVRTARAATKKSFRLSQQLEEAQKNVMDYPIGYADGQRNFTATTIIRDPENVSKVVYGATLIKREKSRVLVPDEENGGKLILKGTLEKRKRLQAKKQNG